MDTQVGGAQLLLSRASTLNLHTGNLVNRIRLRKCPASPYEELQDCIQATLNEWSTTVPTSLDKDPPSTLDVCLADATDAITPDERDELKVTVKLFLTGSDYSSIRSAVDLACVSLGVSQLDSVIIAPPQLPEGESLALQCLQPIWMELEGLVQSSKIAAIGTSDLDKLLLEQLYMWAQIKPSSNQVNLASCCVMPPDLTAFAKEYDIQLLTHNDPKELISAASFQKAIQEGTQKLEGADWELQWVLRYSVIVKSRGIIRSKGYLLQARRNNL
ncbi:glutamate--cysteine ligase regulatory subunit-like [Scleropages formosus]|uniref:Glutamate--cysteine ligase regulatory subunit n=1 Tax=Scleropages formosus TaxID=113540 RepID=A0A0P7X7F2_SCLFO|nr:glutamate--cysteine ligase regulatory subunit-like [Scleropages formosus]